MSKNPDWRQEEVLLACDFVAQNDWRGIPATDQRVIDLSKMLRGRPIHPPDRRLPHLRNANGVGRKTYDLATTDRRVIDRFTDKPAEMHAAAQALRDVGPSSPARTPWLPTLRTVGYRKTGNRLAPILHAKMQGRI